MQGYEENEPSKTSCRNKQCREISGKEIRCGGQTRVIVEFQLISHFIFVKFYSFTIITLCVCVHVCAHMCKTEDNFVVLVFFYFYVGPEIKLSSLDLRVKHIYLLFY